MTPRHRLDALDEAEAALDQRWQDGYAAALRDTAALRRRAKATEKALDRVRERCAEAMRESGKRDAVLWASEITAAIKGDE